MPLPNFPSNPYVGQIVASNGQYYQWNGSQWVLLTSPPSPPTVYVSASPPANPTQGILWYKTSESKLYIYLTSLSGSSWEEVSGGTIIQSGVPVIVSASTPTNPLQGTLWYKTINQKLYLFVNSLSGGEWREISGGSATSESPVIISASAPPNPQNGDLWFDTTNGIFSLWYNDGSGGQWVAPMQGPPGPDGIVGATDRLSYDNGTKIIGVETGFSIPSDADQNKWDEAWEERGQWDGSSNNLDVAEATISLGLGTAAFEDAGNFVSDSDPRLSDAREWIAETVPQPEAEAGTSTTRRAWTAQRVFQSIGAWWLGSSAKVKLDSIEDGATANSTDAQLRDRNTHTGTQTISTVFGLQSALDNKADLVSGLVPSSQLPSYVDDIEEYSNVTAFPNPGETGKIYLSLATGRSYRWSGTVYVEIIASPGTTDAVPEGSINLYFTTGRAANAAPVQSVAGKVGDVTLNVSDVANAVGTSDSRLSDSRNPLPHKSTHSSAGSDPILPGDIGAVSNSDSRLTDSREWDADTVSQPEAEAGSSTVRRAWTAQRVFQAIASWWSASSAKTKLDGIEAGAQVNIGTNLSYTEATRELQSSTGTDVVLPLVNSTIAGLAPASGGGTTNFLRADGSWATPSGTISGITAGTGLSGGGTTGNVTLNLANTAVSAGSYTNSSITVDAQGRITAASSGTAPVTSVGASAPISSSGGTSPTISISAATTSADGSMSASDKLKLDGIEAGAQVNVGTNLSYTASTRELLSSTGSDVTLPLVTSSDAGLAPASGGGTTNFLRADGSWAAPVGGTDLSYDATSRLLSSSTGTDVTLPLFATDSTNAGLVPGSSTGGTTNFLRADGTWASPGATPGGSTTQVQFNDGGSFGGDADLTWNKTTNVLTTKGDLNLDDGGTYTTTLQTITPTANRTISLPDATGTVALVAGSSTQLIYNNAGAYAGLSGVTFDGNLNLSIRFISTLNGAASAPPLSLTGTWFSGGTATTTKPQVLIEPTGTTSTAWSTSGTGLGINAASGFTGRLLDLQLNGTSNFSVDSTGRVSVPLGTAALPSIYPGTDTNTGFWSPAADTLAASTNGTEAIRITSGQNVGINTNNPSSRLHVIGTVTATSFVGGGATKTFASFSVRENQPSAANFATLNTRNSISVLEFDDTTQESCNFIGIIPEGANLSSGILVRIWWMGATATTGNVRWGASFEASGTDLDADSFDTVTQVTSAANATSGIESIAEITCTAIDSLTAGSRFRLRIARIAADATNDTMTGDAQLVAVEVRGVA